jgi:alpha-beta hydrolase superfamily lysophospholipase
VIEATWTAADGETFGLCSWQPSGVPEAVVLGLHGLGCRAADFDPLGRELSANGIAFAAADLRGQGLDGRIERRGAWLETEGLLADLAAFERVANPTGAPLFLCGESMGGLLALQAASREPWRSRLRGVLLLAPVVALAQKNPPWLKRLLRLVATVAPRLRLRPGWFVHGSAAMPPLTRVEERQRYLATAPHRLGPLTLGFLANLGDLIEASPTVAARVDVPVALFSGGHDVFTTSAQFAEFFAVLRAVDRTHFRYDEAYHQLLFDLDADRVVADATRWILSRRSP